MRLQMPIISVDKLKEGDADTFKCLFNHLYPGLYLYANRIVFNSPVAEDIVIDTFVSFWIKRLDFNSLAAIKSFLIITTRNNCFNHLDKVKVRKRAKLEIEIITALEERTRLTEIARREVVNEIFRIIEDLPPRCQKVLILMYSEGLDNQEIAEIMGISKNTVRNQRKRGIQLLKARLKKRKENK